MKTHLLCAFTIALTLLFSTKLFAQNYRPGYIVQAAGDTIQGLIRYREGDRNYKSCLFKTNEDSEAREYTPDNSLAFKIDNDALFESKKIVDKKGNATTAFLEVLVHGNLNLYEYKELLFLEKENSGLKLLSLETDAAKTGGAVGERATVTTATTHLILLNSLTFDCPVPENKMARLLKRLNIPDVIEVVEAYNNCRNPGNSIAYKADKPWMTTEMGILLGGHSTALNFKAGPYSIKDAEFPAANNFIIGGYFNIASPRRSERISLHLEPFYSREKHLGYLELQGPLIIFRNDYIIDIHRFSVLSMARYTIKNQKALNPYFGIGLSSNFIYSGKGTRRLETETLINDVRHIETTISEAFLDKKFYVGATAALGTSYKINDEHKVIVQFRYEQGNYISGKPINHPDFTAHLDNNNSFYLTAAYIIK